MFHFFKKKSIVENNYSFLGADIHNHVLPYIDDGASSFEETELLIHELNLLGFSKLIPTPHVMENIYPNDYNTITTVFNQVILNSKVNKNIFFDINSFSAEYFLDNNFTELRKKGQLLFFGEKNVLIEMSYVDLSQNIEEEIFQLCLLGYQPILAHPERYIYLHRNKDYYHKLVSMGCHFQLNLLSLANYYGKNIQKTALYLLEHNLYHWAGTDVHSLKHIHLLQQFQHNKLFNQIVKYSFYNKSLV